MAISLSVINANADTFQNWVDKTNSVINTIANSVITANTNANGAITTGNAFVVGILGGTTLVANTLRGGNVQSSANLTISTNAIFTGTLITLGANLTLNTSSMVIGANMVLTDSRFSLGNSTVNAVVNSSAVVLSGGNISLTSSGISFGNSTVNAVVNSSAVVLSGAALPLANNKASVAINGTLVGTGTRINFSGAGSANLSATVDAGNSQINVVINSTVSLGNGVGGVNTNILFNDSTNMGGSAAFTFDKTSNTVLVSNVISVNGSLIISPIAMGVGNSTVNATSNSIMSIYANPTIVSNYGTSGFSIGANVTGNTSTLVAGASTVNNTTVSTGTVTFSAAVSGGNVAITLNQISIGNSTVNSVTNSTSLVIGTSTVNTSSLALGANLIVNTSSFLFGNSTVSWTGNSTQIQLANSTIAVVANTTGLAIGANVILTFANVTVGTSVINATSVSSALYTGTGIANTLNYWANTASKVMTTDTLNLSGAYISLTDAASITWDMSTGINFQVTLGGNRTLANPTNPVIGRSGVLRVVEDATGGRTLSFGNAYIFDSDTAVAISTAASKANFLFWHVFQANAVLITLAAKAV